MKKFAISLGALAGLQMMASAGVIDFDNYTGNQTNEGSFIEYGWNMNPTGSDGTQFELNSQTEVNNVQAFASWTSSVGFYTGQTAVFMNYSTDTSLLTEANGGAFSLTSITMADVFLDNNADRITFTGSNGAQDTITLTTPTVMTTYSLTGLNNVTSVQFGSATDAGGNSFYQFNDITYSTATPEPASMALLGLGALALLRRRRLSR